MTSQPAYNHSSTGSAELLALAERVEKLAGPDRGLDAEIYWAIKDGVGVGYRQDAPAFTASLDAAMTLVPEGESYLLAHNQGNYWSEVGENFQYFGATSALAVTAASLHARAALSQVQP